MAWRRIGDKPLPEPMLIQFNDAYMRHWGEMSLCFPTISWFHNLLFLVILCVTIVNRIHYNNVILGAMASQITSAPILYTTVCSGADRRKHQSSALLAFVSEKCFHLMTSSWHEKIVDLHALWLGSGVYCQLTNQNAFNMWFKFI